MRLESAEGAGVSVETDTRDRVIRLETGFGNFKQEVKDDLLEHGRKIDEMYELLTKAKGVGWIGVVMLTLSSALGGAAMWVWQHISFGRLP